VEVRSFKNTDIKFLRNENRGWELFPKKINEVNLSNCDLIQGGQGNYSGECVSNSNGLKFSDISLIKGNRLPRGNQSAYFGNIWNLNSLDITKEFDNEYYKTNSDGSIDAYFDLYYTPQSYFLTGLIFTIISDIVIISISIASFLGIRSEKNTKHIPG